MYWKWRRVHAVKSWRDEICYDRLNAPIKPGQACPGLRYWWLETAPGKRNPLRTFKSMYFSGASLCRKKGITVDQHERGRERKRYSTGWKKRERDIYVVPFCTINRGSRPKPVRKKGKTTSQEVFEPAFSGQDPTEKGWASQLNEGRREGKNCGSREDFWVLSSVVEELKSDLMRSSLSGWFSWPCTVFDDYDGKIARGRFIKAHWHRKIQIITSNICESFLPLSLSHSTRYDVYTQVF